MKRVLKGEKDDKNLVRRKHMADGLLMTFVKVFRNLRLYDLCELVEKNEWVLKKICKLSVSQLCYFKIFKDMTKQNLNYVPDL